MNMRLFANPLAISGETTTPTPRFSQPPKGFTENHGFKLNKGLKTHGHNQKYQ